MCVCVCGGGGVAAGRHSSGSRIAPRRAPWWPSSPAFPAHTHGFLAQNFLELARLPSSHVVSHCLYCNSKQSVEICLSMAGVHW